MSFGKRNRTANRHDVNLRACIEVLGRPPVGCIVHNLSEAGARLELLGRVYLPKSFILRFDNQGAAVRCETARAAGVGIGVRFSFETKPEGLAAKRLIRDTLASASPANKTFRQSRPPALSA